MKLGLGTAQFGLDYGVSNDRGRTSIDEVRTILHTAFQSGITILDTARLYGDSEKVLGETMGDAPFKIITKVGIHSPEDEINMSLTNLRLESLYGILVHNAKDLISVGIAEGLKPLFKARDKGLCQKVGVSVYSPEELDFIVSKSRIDLVQLPLNILDQRFLKDNLLSRLKESGMEIHTRSVFLQGLILLDAGKVHPFFSPVKNLLMEYEEAVRKAGLTKAAVALSFVKNIPEVDHVIVGVNDVSQLRQNIIDWNYNTGFDTSKFEFHNENILDPSKWKIN